jgi:hypothetical protein
MSSETRPSELLKLARAVRERRRADVYDAGAGLAAGGAGSVVFGRGMRKENLRAARNIGRLRSQISDAIKAQKAMPGALDEAERLTAATEAALKRPLQSVPDNVLDAADRFKKKGPTSGQAAGEVVNLADRPQAQTARQAVEDIQRQLNSAKAEHRARSKRIAELTDLERRSTAQMAEVKRLQAVAERPASFRGRTTPRLRGPLAKGLLTTAGLALAYQGGRAVLRRKKGHRKQAADTARREGSHGASAGVASGALTTSLVLGHRWNRSTKQRAAAKDALDRAERAHAGHVEDLRLRDEGLRESIKRKRKDLRIPDMPRGSAARDRALDYVVLMREHARQLKREGEESATRTRARVVKAQKHLAALPTRAAAVRRAALPALAVGTAVGVPVGLAAAHRGRRTKRTQRVLKKTAGLPRALADSAVSNSYAMARRQAHAFGKARAQVLARGRKAMPAGTTQSGLARFRNRSKQGQQAADRAHMTLREKAPGIAPGGKADLAASDRGRRRMLGSAVPPLPADGSTRRRALRFREAGERITYPVDLNRIGRRRADSPFKP